MTSSILTVTQFTNQIKSNLENNFGNIYLQGEISNLSRPASGHFYFNIKDNRSQIAGVMFRYANQKLKFDLENGQEVILHGKVTVYEPRGTYQLLVDSIEPVGVGALQIAYEQLKNKLSREGLFDQEYKKKIPFMPQKIGVVTSGTGAAIQDILTVLRRRYPNLEILINPVKVQGEGSAEEISKAINWFSKREETDLLIIGRGGGSLEDLWAFNEEIVARAVFNCKIPVISAVGHETDFSISDLVADLRAPTPSAAAEIAVPEYKEIINLLDQLDQRLETAIKDKIFAGQEKVEFLSQRLRSPKRVIETHIQRTDELTLRLKRSIEQRLQNLSYQLKALDSQLSFKAPESKIKEEKDKLNKLQEKMSFLIQEKLKNSKSKLSEASHLLDSLSPLTVLNRGYSTAIDKKGILLSSVNKFELEKEFNLVLKDGSIKAKTISIKPNED